MWFSLICFVLLLCSSSAEAPDFIDLSTFSYSKAEVMDAPHLQFRTSSSDITVNFECDNCDYNRKDRKINCEGNELIQTNVTLRKGSKSIKSPFNVSCDASDINVHEVREIRVIPSTNRITISWETPSAAAADIIYYLLHFTKTTGSYTHRIISSATPNTSFTDLNEKSWHQICIASIDMKWITGKFTCRKILTDFPTTGPVTNANASADVHAIYLSWHKPEYQYDIPQGYIVHVKGQNASLCRHTIIISMTNNVPITTPDQACPQQYRDSLTELQQLEIKDLPAYSKFTINIIPFNRDKPRAPLSISIVTKQGESSAVQELEIKRYKDNSMLIGFKEPSMPNGIIEKYRIRIIQRKINMCNETNQIILESHITGKTEGWMKLDNARNCGLYSLEVTPINGGHINGGLGKSSAISFRHQAAAPSPISVNVQFQSQNSISLHLNELHRINAQCQPMGFTATIINTYNQYDCAINVFTNARCRELELAINKSCSNVTYLPFGNHGASVKSVFSGVIRHQSKYKYKISLITDLIREINSGIIGNNEVTDCFTDCNRKGFPYPGVRSADIHGKVCSQWQSSKYQDYKGTKSNICTDDNSTRPWCPATNEKGWAYCDIPECSMVQISTGCVAITATDCNTESLQINWSSSGISEAIIGYIILLHNTNHDCEQYQIQLCNTCQSEESLTIRAKNLYLSCKTGKAVNHISYGTEFKGLHQDKQYILYVMPIINGAAIGEVKNRTIRTKLARPAVPQNVRVLSKSLREIELGWDKPNDFSKHGKPEHYLVKQNSNTVMREKAKQEQIKFSDLEMCTKYCFQVMSINDAGTSELSKENCWFTLAPRPARVEIGDIHSGYTTDQLISWKYLGSDHCARIYRLQWSIKYTTYINQSQSNKTSTKLKNLTRNVNYTVTVTAEGIMETVDNRSTGLPSDSKEFYTGLVDVNVTYYNEHIDAEGKALNISWGIAEEARGSMFEFIIILKNSSQICENLVHFHCRSCQSPWKWVNLPNEIKSTRIKLLKCNRKFNHSFGSNEISFNYIIQSETKLSKFSVEIFGINLLGIHQLSEKSTIIPTRKISTMKLVIVFVSSILFIFIIILIILIKTSKCCANPRNEKYSTIPLTETIQSSNKVTPEISNKPNMQTKNRSNAISVSEFGTYYERMKQNKNEELIKEYKKLGLESKNVEAKLKLTFEAGNDSRNAKKNRFVNILPFDQNRVKVGSKGFPTDYINASYIPFKDDEKKVEYIASQGPIDDNLSDFWQMIWEQNINYIIMLTQTMEGDKFKCLQYWPDEVGETVTFGSNNQYNVKLVEEKNMEGHIERLFNVTKKECNTERNILQLHMHTWSDHSAPNLGYFDKLLFRFQEMVISNTSYPYLIHCSAGVGRTGTLICLDRIIKDLVVGCQEINIYETVLKLRHYRNFIVQRHAQYVFIHEYINHFIGKYMKIENEEMLYFNEN